MNSALGFGLAFLLNMEIFRKLGSTVEERWAKRHHDDAVFHEVAEQALGELKAHQQFHPVEALEWIHRTGEVPAQRMVDSTFGQPPITVFSAQRFYIELLFWLDGTTALHQHGFSGAFQLVAGSSIHSTYRFEQRQRINARMRVGKLSLNRIELLQPGQVRPIRAGDALIHSAFHLDRPSVSLVVRTPGNPEALPQLRYSPPGLAVDTFSKDELERRQLEALATYLEIRPLEALAFVERLLPTLDFEESYKLLEVLHPRMGAQHVVRTLVEGVKARHGEAADWLLPALEHAARERLIAQRRDRVRDPDHRFLLAALLNAPDRASFLTLMSPETAVERLEAIGRGEGGGWLRGDLGVDLDRDGKDTLLALLKGEPRSGINADALRRSVLLAPIVG